MKEKEYGVYDTKDNFILIALGSATDIANIFKTSKAVIYCAISRNTLIKRRFEIIQINE